jgi:hypothetical protein
VASTVGDDNEARTRLEAALALYRETGDNTGVATVAIFLGGLALRQGDVAAAQRSYRTGLELARAVGEGERVADGLEGLAMVATRHAQPERALHLAGAADAIRAALGSPAAPHEHNRMEKALLPARSALTEPAAAAAWTEGNAMSLQAAVEEALAEGN